MIQIKCESCGNVYSLNDNLSGKVAKCKCGAHMNIPFKDSKVKESIALKSLAFKLYRISAVVAVILVIFEVILNPLLSWYIFYVPFFLIGLWVIFTIFRFVEIGIFAKYYEKKYLTLSSTEKILHGLMTFLRCGYYIPWMYFFVMTILDGIIPVGAPSFVQIVFFVALYVILLIGNYFIFVSSHRILIPVLVLFILPILSLLFLKYDIAFIFLNQEFKSKYIWGGYYREVPILNPEAIRWSFEEKLNENGESISTGEINGFFLIDGSNINPNLEFWKMYNFSISVQKNGNEIFNGIPMGHSAIIKINPGTIKNGDVIDFTFEENISGNIIIDLNKNKVGFKKTVIVPSI